MGNCPTSSAGSEFSCAAGSLGITGLLRGAGPFRACAAAASVCRCAATTVGAGGRVVVGYPRIALWRGDVLSKTSAATIGAGAGAGRGLAAAASPATATARAAAKISLREVVGELLEAKEEYVVHQVSCIHDKPAGGLAAAVFKKHPDADVYTKRRESKEGGGGCSVSARMSEPGTISVHEGRIVNVYSQFVADKPVEKPEEEIPASEWVEHFKAAGFFSGWSISKRVEDTRLQRLDWFKVGLRAIPKELPAAKSLAIPKNIGCGLAGGVWSEYETALQEFAAENPGIDITLYARG